MHVHVQKLVSIVKMVTVLEGVSTKEHCAFLLTKELNAENIRKEMFPIYSRMCSSSEVVRKWVEKFSQAYFKVADASQPGSEAAETTVTKKKVLHCGFW
jgi:hypothetical protein